MEVDCRTICDGVAVPYVTEEMFPLLRELASSVALVSEDRVKSAVRSLAVWNKVVAEPSGALSVAAALAIRKAGPWKDGGAHHRGQHRPRETRRDSVSLVNLSSAPVVQTDDREGVVMPFQQCVAGLLGVLLAAGAEASVREHFEQTVAFNPGGVFSIENQNGSIDISVGSESSVRIEAEKEAKTEDGLRDLEIVVEGSGDSVSVRTVQHSRRGSGGVSYRIVLPAEAQIMVSTANGEVSVTGIHGRVQAESVNGALRIEDIAGQIEAETTNGSIRASYQRVEGGRHRFETTNGEVRVYLPADAGGDIEAETVNGSIEVDFPMNLTRTSRHHVRGSFGSGASSFEVSTVNGSVTFLPN